MEMTQQPKSKNTIPILLLSKLLRTRIRLIDCKLKSKVWISRKSMSVRRTNTASGISVAKGSQLIDSHFNTKTIYVYLYGNHSAEVNSFNIYANTTIMEGEIVLLNFNALNNWGICERLS